ncbi:hypothetical protein [Roseococcus microcysteis]|uniref:hypothetical protein n=1 Tax=Roseococcus microcysteis TaxID=2771361 RepID=UPI00168B106C|nr:hypothetical protein [Roseococcus microcysteis]
MQRKLLIIGTSNTIKHDGFAAVLRGMAPPFAVEAVGLGGSPSALLPYMLSSADLAGVTHLAMDPADNGQIWQHGDGVSSLVLWHMVDWLRARGIVPVLLITPQTPIQDIAQAARAARLVEARARGIPVVDGYQLVEDGVCPFDMQDTMHLGPALSGAMMKALMSVVVNVAPGPFVERPPSFAAPRFEAEGAEVIERQSSLRLQRYTLLRPGEVARFSLPAHGMMVGLSFNMLGNPIRVRITSDEAERVERLHRIPPQQDGRILEIIHKVDQLGVALPGRHFALRMEDEDSIELEAAVCIFPRQAQEAA